MIDPKFDKLPAEPTDPSAAKGGNTGARGAGTAETKAPRTGLSINDTVAGDANLSVGARGVDTSGVRSGTGAGGGMTLTNAGGTEGVSVVPGSRSSGTTVRGANDMAATSSTMPQPDTALEDRQQGSRANSAQPASAGLDADAGSSEGSEVFGPDEIAIHAYRCWHERGCPEGSPEVDWQRAEQELRVRRARAASA